MCGRFTLTTPTEKLAEHFELAPPLPVLAPRYNIAPTQLVAVVGVRASGKRGMTQVAWGLVPEWADSPTKGPRVFNVRSESVHFKFGRIFREQRVLIPASGFFEWRAVGKQKHARLFAAAGDEPFAMAGLLDCWQGDGKLIACTAMITTKPNELVAPVHDRMPVIIPREDYGEWLDPGTTERRLLALLKPLPADLMTARDVGRAVNSSKVDGPECIAGIDPPAGGPVVPPAAPTLPGFDAAFSHH